MRSNQTVTRMPLHSFIKQARARGIDWKLAGSRYGVILAIILIPVLGIFRIDVSSGFIVLDRQIWFSDFHIVFGFWLAFASSMIILYSTLGTVFCGWACPQNTFSSWANAVTKKHLGKKAVIDWGDEKNASVAAGKNHWSNWVWLSLKMVVAAMLIALIPLLYFQSPSAVWSFITFQENEELAGSLHWIYTVFTFIALVNIAVVRHFVCRYMCIYRMWQFLFQTSDTLHVIHDKNRKSECDTCNFCETTCTLDINPRDTNVYDSCINCGECITVCNSLHDKDNNPGLLSFKMGPRRHPDGTKKSSNLVSVKTRLIWVAPAFLIGAGLYTWGLINYNPYHLAVYRGEVPRGEKIQDYKIHIANKLYLPVTMKLSVENLPENSYTLSTENVFFETAARQDIKLHIIDEYLKPGLHTFTVHLTADDGWKTSYKQLHLAK